MTDHQFKLLTTRQHMAGRQRVLRVATILAVILLCGYQTITIATAQQGGPTPAFRREAVNRSLAFSAGLSKGLMSPFKIRQAWLSRTNGDFYCVTFEGDGWGELFSVFVWCTYDKNGIKITGLSRLSDPDEYTQNCGRVYPLPEAVGRMFK